VKVVGWKVHMGGNVVKHVAPITRLTRHCEYEKVEGMSIMQGFFLGLTRLLASVEGANG